MDALKLILATESNREYTMRRIKFIYDLRADKIPRTPSLDKNQGRHYEHFSPVPDFTDGIRRPVIRNFFCYQALQMVLNIAAQNDPWFRGYGLHSEAVQPELFPEPNAATMKVDLSIESAILPLIPTNFTNMISDIGFWVDSFADIVYRAEGEKLSATAPDILDLQRVTAFFKPRRTPEKIIFTRFKKVIGPDMWAVIDFDLDAFERPSRTTSRNPPVQNARRRRPSGVIVGKYNDSNCKVIWIENMEVLVNSAWPFKASHWIHILKVLNFERDYSLSYYMELADENCSEYMQYGRCTYGAMCPLNHPGRQQFVLNLPGQQM